MSGHWKRNRMHGLEMHGMERVIRKLPFVLATREVVVAWQRTDVVDVNAAFLITFVFSAATFFRASFFAAHVIARSAATLDCLIG